MPEPVPYQKKENKFTKFFFRGDDTDSDDELPPNVHYKILQPDSDSDCDPE
jgi:hypothetical protein